MQTFTAMRSFVFQYSKTIAAVTVTGLGLFGVKKWMAGGVCIQKPCWRKALLEEKAVLITEDDTGIGREMAVDLAERGASRERACRDMDRANKAVEDVRKRSGNDNVIVKKLDLASLQSVRQHARDVLASEERLDVLINNAGQIYFDDIHQEKDYCPSKSYAQSKLANVLYTRELANELQGTGVTSLHPGIIRTELSRHVLPTMHLWKRVVYAPLIFLIKNPTEGAQTTMYCAVEESLQNESGLDYSDCAPKTAAPQGLDDEANKKLWDLSASMVGLIQSQ